MKRLLITLDQCDKCGETVPNNNNAIFIDAFIGDFTCLLGAQARHLLPTDTCVGSRSRAQYVNGIMDPRYPFDETLAPKVRDAYAQMQELP